MKYISLLVPDGAYLSADGLILDGLFTYFGRLKGLDLGGGHVE